MKIKDLMIGAVVLLSLLFSITSCYPVDNEVKLYLSKERDPELIGYWEKIPTVTKDGDIYSIEFTNAGEYNEYNLYYGKVKYNNSMYYYTEHGKIHTVKVLKPPFESIQGDMQYKIKGDMLQLANDGEYIRKVKPQDVDK